MLMAWGEQSQLGERFDAVRSFLQQTCRHWKLGSSYEGWVAAQKRDAARVIPLVVRRLRKTMRQLAGFQRRGRWDIYAVDGSQATCPRTMANQEVMGDVGKPGGMPLLSLTSIQHVRSGLPWDFRVGPGDDSERAHLREMLDDLPAGSLLVADAGFIGYDLCCEMLQRQQHFLLRVGGNMHLLSELGYDFEVQGQTVYLWPEKQQRKNLPPVALRLIVVQDEDKQPVYLATSVLEPDELSDEEAAEIYRLRWGIEVLYRTAKQTLEHHTMRSRTPENCYLEMTWAFLGVWLLKLMSASKIAAAGGDPLSVSPAQARNAVRRSMRGDRPCRRTRQSLPRVLARCRIDTYTRRRPKTSRDYPRKKQHKPPGPPTIKPPDSTQLRKAKQLTPMKMQR
jgi:IS4 transposase